MATTSTLTSQDSFLQLVLSQMLESKKRDNFQEKLQSFFLILPDNSPQFLLNIEAQLEKFKTSPERTKQMETKLKQAWFTVWKSGNYQKNQAKYFERYYPRLTNIQQQNLAYADKLQKTKFPSTLQEQKKSISPIALVSAEYKKTGELKSLSDFIQKETKLNATQMTKLIQLIDPLWNISNPMEEIKLVELFQLMLIKSDFSFRQVTSRNIYNNNFGKAFFLLEPGLFKKLHETFIKQDKHKENSYLKLDYGNYSTFFSDFGHPISILVEALVAAHQEKDGKIYLHKDKFLNFCENVEGIYPQYTPSFKKLIHKKIKDIPNYEGNLIYNLWQQFTSSPNMTREFKRILNNAYIRLDIDNNTLLPQLGALCTMQGEKKLLGQQLQFPIKELNKQKIHKI